MRLFGRHAVEEAAQGGLAGVGTFFDPADRDADHRPADHRQVEGGGAVANAAAVFSGGHIQAQVQARFNAPIAAVGSQHFPGTEGGAGARTEQILGFDLCGGVFLTVKAAGQAGRLLHEGESHGLGRGVEGDEAARLGAAAIALAELNRVGFNLRGKKRAPNLGRVVARFRRRPSDCL